jgi:hypothetical protein
MKRWCTGGAFSGNGMERNGNKCTTSASQGDHPPSRISIFIY